MGSTSKPAHECMRVNSLESSTREFIALTESPLLPWEDHPNHGKWKSFEQRAFETKSEAKDGIAGWAWAQDKVADWLEAVPNSKKSRDGGVDAWYVTTRRAKIPIQVKMHKRRLGTVDLIYFLGTLKALQLHGWDSPIGVLVCLYRPSPSALNFARGLGTVAIKEETGPGTEEYPLMQVISVEEMIIENIRPSLPSVDPGYLEVAVQLELPFEITRRGTVR